MTMKMVRKLVTVAGLWLAAQAGAQALDGAPLPEPGPQLTQSMIRDAVRAVLAEEAQVRDAQPQAAMQQVTIRADRKYEQFSAVFAEAKVPDCLHADGLKRQPTGIGPLAIGGVYALPFVAIAKLRGKCN
ncbi:hypothetical protein [Janthinobacterium sp. MDT1-19]|uniref:hypothetical protein n=1 Tax=Janthinobacterium sp. MDT1-19 TaxID=1259339 RepID=UPI003F27D476